MPYLRLPVIVLTRNIYSNSVSRSRPAHRDCVRTARRETNKGLASYCPAVLQCKYATSELKVTATAVQAHHTLPDNKCFYFHAHLSHYIFCNPGHLLINTGMKQVRTRMLYVECCLTSAHYTRPVLRSITCLSVLSIDAKLFLHLDDSDAALIRDQAH
jgi:hypothetical protein